MPFFPSFSSSNHNFLDNVDICNRLLAVKTDCWGKQHLVSIPKYEVTAWQLFLRAFGFGNLARLDPYLSSVSTFLRQYDWSNATHNDTYRKVCMIANKALYSKGDVALYNQVSGVCVDKAIDFCHYQDYYPSYRATIMQALKLNPYTQVKHIEALVKSQRPFDTVRITNQWGQMMNRHEVVDAYKLQQMRIEISHYETSRVVVINRSRPGHCTPNVVVVDRPAPTCKLPPRAAPLKASTGFGATKRR